MTDQPSDPWKSLAAELGVDASEPAPPPPSSTTPPRSSSGASPPPLPKKSSSDWLALAGELGIDVPPEAGAPPPRRDPVAELLGFPPPAPDAPFGHQEKRKIHDEQEHDEELRHDDHDQPRDRWQSSEVDETDEPDGISNRESRADEDHPRDNRQDISDRGSRGRQRRGGRGRRDRRGGRPERNDRSDSERRSPRRFEDRERPPIERQGDSALEELPNEIETGDLDDIEARQPPDPESGQPEAHFDSDESRQKRRRRRGRRGRGGSRNRDDSSRETAGSSTRSGSIRPAAESVEIGDEIEFVEMSEEEDRQEPVDAAAEPGDNGHEDTARAIESNEGKSSVRDIMTWKEAIGMIIEGNLQARARSPQSSHGSHGSRGRDRGRGRGHRGG